MKFDTREASSAPSERLFSGGKLVLEIKHNCLGDENFEKSLLLNFNKTSTQGLLDLDGRNSQKYLHQT